MGTARARWVALFAALFLVTSAVPVVGAEPPGSPAEEIAAPPVPEDFDPSRLPDAEDVGAAIDRAEREEEERKAWLVGSEAVREREASRFAFADLDATGAENLLRTVFTEQLAQLNQDPARFLSDAQLVSTSEPTSATVKDDGGGLVMESSLPVRAEDEEGDLHKVDLSLEETASGYETENALVEVQIPESADQPVKVGDEGVAIKLAGVDEESISRPFGDENRLAVDVFPDTDMLVSPIATGVEIFNVLRSEDSPETLRFQVGMPAGAVLRADGGWGAEIVRDGELLSTIPKPTAVDAQGTDVPVDLAIDGNSLVLHVDHRDGDYAMPILVDPILENNENWIYGQNLNALDMGVWAFSKNVSGMYGSTGCIYHCFGQPSTVRGLFVSGQSGTYWPNQFAQWSYSTPNPNSYISSATLFPYGRFDHDCNAATTQYKEPHDYFGLWNPQGWAVVSINPGGVKTLEGGAQAAIFGLGSGGGPVFSIPCWRDIYAGGAHVWMGDWGNPWIESVNGIPSGWVSNETPFTVTAVARDEGLGIKNVRIHQTGGETIYDVPPQNECAGTRRSLCQTVHNASFDLHGGYFFPGERDVWLSADDATGKYTGDYHWTMRVDNTPPEITLKGQFAEATEEVGSAEVPAGEGDQLSLPVYRLEIEAKDGSWDNPLNKRSGVKDIEIYLDGAEQSVSWSAQPCSGPNYSCEMKKTYPVQLSKLTTSGKHVLKVEAVDQVGKRQKREIEFEYFPATGMKDEYAMHYFPLPDGSGSEAEEEHPDRPELAVNVMNGNLVYREQDIEVEGAGVDLEVERYYNSMLPENEETEWGDGWTLAQTPQLDPIKTGGSPVPNQAEILDSSGAIEDEVGLPTAVGAEKFDPALQATLTKKTSGGYELTDETGESATSIAFDASGQTEALLSAGHAKVDYSYEGGELAEIEVSDPATFAADPAELEIPEPEQITKPTYANSFGSNGSGDGQLKSPADVAVDPQGNLWVVDKANNRIQKFDPSGKYLAKFGSLGPGDGQFNRPTSIAIASDGNLLVTDAGNGRIQRFSSAGAYISKFGSKGSGNGQFNGSGPEGIAVDAVGNVWVSDTYGGRVQKFNSAGEFVKVAGSKGSGSGQLGEPTGIAVDPSGNLWVADWQNNRVSVFNSNGEFLSQFGSTGSGEGQFSHPDEIEIDKLGNVWVGDQSNNRVQQFDLAGQFKGKFGAAGSGPGQFNLAYPMGIAADSKGHLWIADVNNHRIQHWLVPVERPAYVRSFGSAGSGDGQLWLPADVALGVEGSLLVVDKGNSRIQRFDEGGKYLGQFGSYGTGDGQFNRPMAIAVDRDGNLLVADSSNNRIQKFSPEGAFIAKFGSAGIGNGQFSSPEGIATDFEGNIWVADSGNGRIQKFDEEGEFLAVVGSKGSAPGQLSKPVGIDTDPEGRIWVSDFQNHRVSIFEGDGDFLGQFGSLGTEPGQFNRPSSVEIDAHDNVWVADQGNGRVQRFDLTAQYVGQFGSKGTGEGQFSFPIISPPVGIATDRTGRIWVTDMNSNRIQQWMLGHYAAAEPAPLDLSDGDPKVEVETPGGLVSSVSGNAAGEHTYEHEGDFLTSHNGPEGETLYKKNAVGLLSEVNLANGTWAKIKYYADKRVESVEVAPNGVGPKMTKFSYEDSVPRRTTVSPANQPQIVYDIGADGSVFKWWHKDTPPEIIALNGSLGFDKNGKEVAAGDLVLEVDGDSPHGVSSIQIIANGNQLVSEKTCEQDPDPQIECTRLEDLWVTDTASLAPGMLNIEVIIANELERSTSKRWSVTIPRTPPPVPGYPVAPKFSEIQKFREDYGLEIVFPVANERELVERIFNLINAWHSPGTPAGEVARASWERWGVPLRPEDVAELEYRDRYFAQAASVIPSWAAANAPGSYAGLYMDHRSGGILRVGFTSTQAASVAQLIAGAGLMAPGRVAAFPYQPSHPLTTLKASLGTASQLVATPSVPAGLLSVGIDVPSNSVRLGTMEVAATEAFAAGAFPGGSGVIVVSEVPPGEFEGRYKGGVPFLAGTILRNVEKACEAGFGAWSKIGTKQNGDPIRQRYVMTAGHCFPKAENSATMVSRMSSKAGDGVEIGRVERQGFLENPSGIDTDAEAVALEKTDLVPSWIYGCCGGNSSMKVTGVAFPKVGETVCQSSAFVDKVTCGPVTSISDFDRIENRKTKKFSGWHWMIRAALEGGSGDSGGPVWMRDSGAAVGLVAGGGAKGLAITPFMRPSDSASGQVAGIFSDPRLSPPTRPLHVQVAN
jgi:tripartite motif-containing protein 71